jgi:hypothetical protein
MVRQVVWRMEQEEASLYRLDKDAVQSRAGHRCRHGYGELASRARSVDCAGGHGEHQGGHGTSNGGRDRSGLAGVRAVYRRTVAWTATVFSEYRARAGKKSCLGGSWCPCERVGRS